MFYFWISILTCPLPASGSTPKNPNKPTNHVKQNCRVFSPCAQAKQKVLCIINVVSPKDSDWPVYISWECAQKGKKRKKRSQQDECVSGSERVLPSFRSDGSSINALLSERSGERCLIFLLETEKKKKKTQTKTVAFVSCRKSYTHRSPFSNYFLIWSFTVAISVQSFGTCFLCQTFCLLMNCHVHNVIFILNFIIVFFFFSLLFLFCFMFCFELDFQRLRYFVCLFIWCW